MDAHTQPPCAPQAWVVREPMVVLPMRTVMNTAVAVGSPQQVGNGSSGAGLSYAGSMSPQHRDASGHPMIHHIGGGSPAAAGRAGSQPQDEYRMDLYIGSNSVALRPPSSGGAPASAAMPSNAATLPGGPAAADNTMAALHNEVAFLRGELVQANQQRDAQLDLIAHDLRRALHAVDRLSQENAALREQVARADSNAVNLSLTNVTAQDLFKSLALLPTAAKPKVSDDDATATARSASGAGSTSAGGKPPSESSMGLGGALQRARTLEVTESAIASPTRQIKTPLKPPSSAGSAAGRKPSFGGRSAASSKAADTERLRTLNTAIAGNDEITLDQLESTVRSQASNRSLKSGKDSLVDSMMSGSAPARTQQLVATTPTGGSIEAAKQSSGTVAQVAPPSAAGTQHIASPSTNGTRQLAAGTQQLVPPSAAGTQQLAGTQPSAQGTKQVAPSSVAGTQHLAAGPAPSGLPGSSTTETPAGVALPTNFSAAPPTPGAEGDPMGASQKVA